MVQVRMKNMSFSRKPLVIVLVISLFMAMLLPAAAMAQANDAAKEKVFRKVAMELVESAKKQQQRGLYAQAERSLQQAKKYEQYLTADEQAQLNALLRTVQGTATQRDEIAEHIRMADVYISQGDFLRARAHLETAKQSEQLTAEERQQIDAALRQIEARLNEQKKQIAELYDRSVKLYRTGQLEQARAGFVTVAASGRKCSGTRSSRFKRHRLIPCTSSRIVRETSKPCSQLEVFEMRTGCS